MTPFRVDYILSTLSSFISHIFVYFEKCFEAFYIIVILELKVSLIRIISVCVSFVHFIHINTRVGQKVLS